MVAARVGDAGHTMAEVLEEIPVSPLLLSPGMYEQTCRPCVWMYVGHYGTLGHDEIWLAGIPVSCGGMVMRPYRDGNDHHFQMRHFGIPYEHILFALSLIHI